VSNPFAQCSLSGFVPLCLSSEQAERADVGGLDIYCGDDNKADNLLDTSCILSGATDAAACSDQLDKNAHACHYCTMLNCMVPACLTSAQAELASSTVAATCDTPSSFVKADPLDPSCIMAYLQNPTADGCTSATDEDGAACEYCMIANALNLCLTAEQAQETSQFGVQCAAADKVHNLQADTSCLVAYLQNPTAEACAAAQDLQGHACEYCHLGGANVCLTEDQAEIAGQLGAQCDAPPSVELPPDFFKCLTNYQQRGCNNNGCTWCNTQVGMGFCMANNAAEALKDCTFFDCNYGEVEDKVEEEVAAAVKSDPYDLACMAAGMGSDDAEAMCQQTKDGHGDSCVWCNAAGVFGVCVSAEQAAKVGTFLDCDAVMVA
jgi:hypothetical protein